jgi:hypothetical protein
MQHEAMKPKTGKLTETQNKQPNTKKKDPKPNPQDLSRPSKNIPPYFEATGTRGRRLRLAGVSICNRTAAGQPDVESLCPSWAPFRPSDDGEPKNPTSVGGSRWASKRGVRLGSDIRSGRIGVDAVETVTKRVKMVEKTIRRISVSSGEQVWWRNLYIRIQELLLHPQYRWTLKSQQLKNFLMF